MNRTTAWSSVVVVLGATLFVGCGGESTRTDGADSVGVTSQALSLHTLFDETLPEALAKNPNKAAEIGHLFQVDITGDKGGDWTIDATKTPATVVPGRAQQFDILIEAKHHAFARFVRLVLAGKGSQAMRMAQRDRIHVIGDPALLQSFADLLSLVNDSGSPNGTDAGRSPNQP